MSHMTPETEALERLAGATSSAVFTHAGVRLTASQARSIAAAITAQHDDGLYVEELVSRHAWEAPEIRSAVLNGLRRSLAVRLAESDYLPVAPPTVRLRYRSYGGGFLLPEEVTPEAAWDEVVVRLDVPVRGPYTPVSLPEPAAAPSADDRPQHDDHTGG